MSDITFRFVAIGQNDVRYAFKQNTEAALEFERAVKKLDAAQAQAARQRASGRSAPLGINKDDQRAANSLMKTAITAQANDRKRLERDAKLSEASQLAIAKQGAQERIRVAKQEFDSKLKARQDAFKKEQAISKDATRAELDAQKRANAQALTQKRYAYEAEQTRRKAREDNSLFAGVGGQVKGAVIGGVLAAGALGIGVAGAAGRDALRLREVSNRLSISSRGAGQEAVDPKALQEEFQRTAINTPGQTAAGIAEAVQAFVTKTGRLDVARSQQGVFATVASATGGNVVDIAGAAADISQKMNITKMSDMQEALASLTFQGKQGAFELSDAARLFPRLLAAGSAFGVKQDVGGLKQIGGFAQIARTSTGGGEQATTAIENVFTALKVKSKEIERIPGVKVYEGQGSNKRTRSFTDILADVVAKAGGADLKAKNEIIGKIFGEQGMKALNPLVTTAMKAMAETKGTDDQKKAAARAAVTSQFSQAINAPGDWAELQKDAAQAQQDTSAKLTAAWEKITATAGNSLIPVFTALADKIAENPEAIQAFADAVSAGAEAMLDLIKFIEDVAGKKILSPEKREEKFRKDAEKAIKEEAKVKASVDSKENAAALQKQGKTAEAAAMLTRLADPKHAAEEADKVRKAEVNSAMARNAVGKERGFEDEVKKTRSLQEFQEYYASLGNQGLTGKEEASRVERAKDLAAKVAAKPLDFQGDRALSMGYGKEGETQEQAIARKAFAQQQGERRVQFGGSAANPNGAQLAGSSVILDAAKLMMEAAKQMSAQGNGSVLGKAP